MRKELQSAFNTRQYMVTKDYELFYYNDLHSKDGKSHRHDYYEFYIFVEGKVRLIIDKQKYVMKPGDAYVIPPGIFHYAQILDNTVHYRRFVFWISTKYLDSLNQQTSDFDYVIKRSVEQEKYLYHFDKEKFNSLQNKLMQLLEEMHADRYGKEFALTHAVEIKIVQNFTDTFLFQQLLTTAYTVCVNMNNIWITIFRKQHPVSILRLFWEIYFQAKLFSNDHWIICPIFFSALICILSAAGNCLFHQLSSLYIRELAVHWFSCKCISPPMIFRNL